MKVCPRCQKTYTDDNLNFCLEDGSVLSQAGNAPMPETVLINQPRITASNPPSAGQPGGQANWGSSPQQYSMQPAKKSSKTWVWVLLILGVVVLICGGGAVGFFAWVATLDTNTNSTYQDSRANSTTRSNSTTATSSPTTSEKFTKVEEIDLSVGVQNISIYGETEFKDGEFYIKCRTGYVYYVLLASPSYSSDLALTTAAVRNSDNGSTERGFGIVFHSNPSPLVQDYAFLIDSKKKRYRVVRHDAQKELVVVKWTNFAGIKDGTEKNILEVRDEGENVVLSINGQQVTTIPDKYGYSSGSVGMYTSGEVRAAFSDFQVKK